MVTWVNLELVPTKNKPGTEGQELPIPDSWSTQKNLAHRKRDMQMDSQSPKFHSCMQVNPRELSSGTYSLLSYQGARNTVIHVTGNMTKDGFVPNHGNGLQTHQFVCDMDAASDTNCASVGCLVRDFRDPSADRQHEAGRQYAAGQSPVFEEKRTRSYSKDLWVFFL